ncbi:MAG: hypothetical protein WD603_03210 [Patescibacteria group bacterium]
MASQAEVPVAFYPGSEYAPGDIRETAELLSLVFMGGYEGGNDGSVDLKVEGWNSSELLGEWSEPEMHFTFLTDAREPAPGVGRPVVPEEPFDDRHGTR